MDLVVAYRVYTIVQAQVLSKEFVHTVYDYALATFIRSHAVTPREFLYVGLKWAPD